MLLEKLSKITKGKPACYCPYCKEPIYKIGQFPANGFIEKQCEHCFSKFMVECKSIGMIQDFHGVSYKDYHLYLARKEKEERKNKAIQVAIEYSEYFENCQSEHELEDIKEYLGDAMSSIFPKNF